ncbi:MAG: hypothetical protein II218_04760 [Peptococcaceae bacterium]|nr:hypothetical protein [Peptococcaceae bacterium]MBQ2035202.1 hypothetical protein [Peptococcaceae bacterium]MBQ5857698.1 hypothetical protein [Peptococcaceae bacterium]
MYLVNQRIIRLVKATVLLGVPLLTGFVFSQLAFWKLPAALLVATGYSLNNIYPDRIRMEEDAIGIKIFLHNDWLIYKPEQVQYQRTEQCVYLYIDGKRTYRINLDKLSVRLYTQITAILKPYREIVYK